MLGSSKKKGPICHFPLASVRSLKSSFFLSSQWSIFPPVRKPSQKTTLFSHSSTLPCVMENNIVALKTTVFSYNSVSSCSKKCTSTLKKAIFLPLFSLALTGLHFLTLCISELIPHPTHFSPEDECIMFF
jgi:hypothetical protein